MTNTNTFLVCFIILQFLFVYKAQIGNINKFPNIFCINDIFINLMACQQSHKEVRVTESNASSVIGGVSSRKHH